MLKYTGKKILQMFLMLLLISFIIFAGLQATGIDPVSYLISPDMAANTENMERLREKLGLNEPFLLRYFHWLKDVLSGNLGYSISYGNSIKTILRAKLPATFWLTLVSLLLSTILGIGIGIVSAVRQNGLIDYVGRILAVIGQAIPQFLMGIILIQIFAIKLGWLPTAGSASAGKGGLVDTIRHLILPVAALSLSMCAVLMRYARNSLLNVLNCDYIKTARSKGIPEWKVYIKHGFRNSMRPVLVILIFRLPMLVGGSVVIESVFSWPGIGPLITASVIAGDYPVVMVTTLIVAAMMLISSFLVDVMTAVLDPRVRFE